jgi:hypothetical protein
VKLGVETLTKLGDHPSRATIKETMTSMNIENEHSPRNSEQQERNNVQFAELQLRASDDDLIQEAKGLSRTTASSDVEHPSASCPFANDNNIIPMFVPLTINGRSHVASNKTSSIVMANITVEDLTRMTERFYELAFCDQTLDPFLRSHDDPHASRFAKWIYQKLVRGSTAWDKDRQSRDLTPVVLAGGTQHVVHDRSSAHVAAWYSSKRSPSIVGRHFQLDECRVWMRLHFYALRETLMKSHPTFADYYVRFIAHFVRVYEGTAPSFARDSFRWSAEPENIKTYIRNGRVMKDVLGLALDEAQSQIPASELFDYEWPYNKTESFSVEVDFGGGEFSGE